MQTSAEPVYSASSPPFIIDSDMSGKLDLDPDFESLDSSFEAANSPGIFLAEDFATDTSQYLNFGSPAPTAKSPLPDKALLDTCVQQSLSTPSTTSSAGSYKDSSSESSGYKRKSSSESTRSVLTPGDLMMTDDADMGDWKMEDLTGGTDMSAFGAYDGTINPASMSNNNFDFNDKTMENDFDFESAASSPSPFGMGPADSPEMPTIKYATSRKKSPMLKNKLNKSHNKANSQHSVTQSMNGLTTSGSREASPLSAMVTSQESSPAAFLNTSPSPAAGVDFHRTMLSAGPPNSAWPIGFENYPQHGLPNFPHGLNPHPMPRMAPPQGYAAIGAPFKPVLTIHPTPLKSRVETQIPIKLTLFPMPMGVSKLHLPTHTISKPKLLAKPTAERSSDTLELYTTLVCTSAMQNPDNRRRAFERAAAAAGSTPKEKQEDDEEDEEDKPLNGGDVNICPGCIIRERKRAARKKVKKVEEEESWHQYEAKRVIVFNTHEIKDWQAPTSQPSTEVTGDRAEPFVPEGALQVDAPMRIACYCRHQNEKHGFQVLFTIKDHQDRLIAQEMTSSIMITDDHKTHNMPPLTTQTSNGSDGQMYSGSGSFQSDGTFDMNPSPAGTMAPFRLSHSSSDLQAMGRNFNPQQFTPSMSLAASPQPSHSTSATMTPRNQSRQTSPSTTSGPISKKRKASMGKVPTTLAMTRLETAQPGPVAPPVSLSATASTAPSPFTPSFTNFPPPNEQQFGQPSTAIPQQYNTGPPTPNSNDHIFFSNHNRSQSVENLALAQQLYSAPTSAHPSRAPSPNGMRTSVQAYQQQQAQIAQAVANGIYGIPLSLNPHRPPTIHKLIPNEGPKAGGIEVTCLGSGFCQGLEVMFGDSKATTTTFWGETSLVCLLPPAAFPGMVPVTFKHQHQQQPMQPYPNPPIPKQQAFFKYVDDDEQQIIRTALSVLGHKMTGKMEDVRDLARRIVGDGPSSWGASAAHSPSGGPSSQQGPGFNAATFGIDVEATLLKCLDLIDLDDSANMPRLNLRRASGQTMLHLACSLGLHRFVAGLLARGANPEPRDKGGFTPMHFAALHGHPQIVRRLMLSGADPTLRSLQGYTPSDMATSEEVLRVARRIEYRTRTRSGSSLRSRTTSATSLRSLWEPSSTLAPADHALSDDSDDGDNEYEDEDADAALDGAFWMRSRRPSAQKPTKEEVADENDPVLELPDLPTGGLAYPTAAMTAIRDQLSANMQYIQQTMHLNLPHLPQMPNLPDYQAYLPTAPMVRRISNLVVNNRPEGSKEHDYKWWEFFSGTVPAAPPAYEEIFPEGDADTKRASASQAAADAVADNKCAELFDQTDSSQAESSTTVQKKPVLLSTVRIGQKHTITREQQDQLRLAHAEKVKRLSRDRNLFFIWIPLLTIIILAMLYNHVPQVYTRASKFLDSIRNRRNDQARIVEV